MATYLFEEDPITCVSIETELGLNRGDVTQLNIYPSGAVEITTGITLNAAQQSSVKKMLLQKGMSLGKKP